MSGYSLVKRIRSLESSLDKLGFAMTSANYRDYGDVVAIIPKDQDSLPIYSRDAELFIGSIEELEQWIKGIEWSRKYDSMLFGKKHDSNRERKEQDYRNSQLVSILKE